MNSISQEIERFFGQRNPRRGGMPCAAVTLLSSLRVTLQGYLLLNMLIASPPLDVTHLRIA